MVPNPFYIFFLFLVIFKFISIYIYFFLSRHIKETYIYI